MKSKSVVRFTLLTNPGAAACYVKQLQMNVVWRCWTTSVTFELSAGSDSQPLQTLPVNEGLHAYLLALRRRACVLISPVSDKSIFTLPHFDGSSLLLCQQPSLALLNAHQVNLSYQLIKKTSFHTSQLVSGHHIVFINFRKRWNYLWTLTSFPAPQCSSWTQFSSSPLHQHYIVKKLRTIKQM